MNPLYSQMNNNGLLQRFMQFKQTFRGDPQAQVQQLLNSGKITQDDYNKAVQQAKQLQSILRNII